MADHEIKKFGSGVHNREDNEDTPKDSAKDALNWTTIDGRTELARGKVTVGDEGAAGNCPAIHPGYKANGVAVLWRKISTKIQYFNGSQWVDVVIGLNAADLYVFTNYSSLTGAWTFAGGPGGLFKFSNANPGDYIQLYTTTDFFCGYPLIDKARMYLWGIAKDATALYRSYIDAQRAGTSFTQVSNENLASGNGVQVTFTGTLSFKAGGAKRNCGLVTVKCTDGSGEIFTDDKNGVLKGSAGGTGTINYITGAWSVTFVTVPSNSANNVKADYVWEDSTSKGVADFTYSATRLAGEGDVIRQDEGGDSIQQLVIGIDGNYYSIKKQSAYQHKYADDDKTFNNQVVRRNIGILTRRSAVATGRGVVFINTANPDRPQLTVLEKNPLGDDILATELIPHFAWEQFDYSDAFMETYGQFVLLSCREEGSIVNDRMLIIDITKQTVDITNYGMKSLSKDGGVLYGGSPHTETVYKVLNGFDDDGATLENFWDSKYETYGMRRLKKYRRLRYRGEIDPAQYVEVYADFDGAGYTLVGTIRGDASYVNRTSPSSVGTTMVGEVAVGGDGVTTVYPYEMQIKAVKIPKFRRRSLRFIAKGIGYVSIMEAVDWDILTYEDKLPKLYRQKEHVSLDGTETDQ
jgi:hypothetical protein